MAWPKVAAKPAVRCSVRDGGDAGFYPAGEYDLARFAVGVVEKTASSTAAPWFPEMLS